MFYFLLSVGVSVNFHYCEGKFAGLAFVKGEKDSICQMKVENEGCCKSKNLSGDEENEEQSKDDCCDDEQYFLQFDTDQKLIQTLRLAVQKPIVAVDQTWDSGFSLYADNSDEIISNTDLPPPDDEPLWLLNCSLRYHC